MRRSVSQANGFTLVEMMLVLVVVAVIVAMAGLAVGGNPAKELEREARRLQAVLQLASEEAVLQGLELALALQPANADAESQGRDSYQFIYLDTESRRWEPYQDKSLAEHSLPVDISLDIRIDGQQLDRYGLEQLRRLQSLQAEDALKPLLMLFSSGELSPFSITFRHRQAEQELHLSSDGLSGLILGQLQ